MDPSQTSQIPSYPMPTGPGEEDIPVKLTPINGRVSRAKKGVPIHICDICKPPKSFTRAEHLSQDENNQANALATGSLIWITPPEPQHQYSREFSHPHGSYMWPSAEYRQPLFPPHFVHDAFGQESNWPSSASGSLYTTPSRREVEKNNVGTTGADFEIATDSGYGSLGSGQRKDQMRNTLRTTLRESSTSTQNLEDDDNHTVYSDSQSLSRSKLEVYISEFAEELVAALPRSISAEQLPILSAALPDLLKAFSIRFGCEWDTLSEYRLIQISKAVVDTYTIEEQEIEQEVQKPDDGMPIQDKMLLWARMNHQVINDTGYEASSSDQGDDNPLENDVSEDYPEITEYRQTLVNSVAYSGLLRSVIGEVTLQTPSGGKDVHGDIRKKILGFLHEPSIISQRSAPEMKRFGFEFPWIRNYLVSQEYKQPINEVLPQAMVIVGVENQSFVTTCGEYIGTVWPTIGPQLLSLCMDLLSNPHGSYVDRTCFDGTKISAKVNHDGSIVELGAIGNVYSLAEIGEVMIWLNAAFDSSSIGDGLYYRTPGCEMESAPFPPRPGPIGPFTSAQPSTTGKSYLKFTMSESHSKVSADVDSRGRCWINLFGNRPVVSGYPIPRRTAKGTGAEMSLDLMAHLVDAKRVSDFSGSILIKGCSAALIPTQRTEDMIMWHLVFDQSGGYLSYTDPRVKNTLKDTIKGLTRGALENSRHILGWCSSVLNHTGAADANYSIGWSSLKPPAPGFAFEKISIVGGMFVTAGVSTIIGKRDRAVHFRCRDDYTMRLKWISKKFVVLYDVQEKRAWLLNGASALLHLVRASLQHDLNDPFKEQFLYQESALLDSPSNPYSGKDAAVRVLLNPQNLGIPLYAKPDAKRVETTIHQGREVKVESSTQTNYCLKDRIEDICNVLEQMMAHQADTCTQDGVGFKVKASDRRHIEGFDFMDIATDEDPCFPRQVTLCSSGRGWVDFVRAIHAVTLFGSRFGDLISPAKTNADTCASCYSNMNLPRGQDLLAVCVSELDDILQKRGSKATTPWRLVDDIYWLTPDKTFEPCHPGQKCDRVQVLLPATFPKLWGRKFKSPGDLGQAPRGALIFGHSRRFPLRWGDRGDPEQGHADQDNDVEGLQSSMQDSGIGSSLDSSSGNDTQSPPSTSSSSQSRERTRTPVHTPERENESDQRSKRRKLNDYFSKMSRER
ncbi:hypothetical protein NPX13_g3802 [Xylaria arbuscula]|uniref:Pfs domain protein n=1 Tax=Xylaria arbuscula TaxID=114810 RepID=A0A9W8NGL2_9PEZI|nr:hypothetical protein NPX13_g3802 [Xylaria arbuscula]